MEIQIPTIEIVIIIFFFFTFRWLYRLLMLSVFVKVISKVKEETAKKIKNTINNNKGDEENAV